MKGCFCLTAGLLLILSAVSLSAQTAAEMERLLDTKEITFTEAAYFTLASVMEKPPEYPSGAFILALEKGWLPGNAEPNGSIQLRNLSSLMMGAFNLEGGLMYRLFPGPRYAFREMSRRGFIEGRAYPRFTVSGERFLQILGNILSHTGDAELPETEAALRPLPENVWDSLRDSTREHQGLSAGSEAVQGYESDFEPE
jgi:hypothetical protein